MERGFIGLDIAVLAVSDAATIADDVPARVVIEKLEAAGHRVVARERIDDSLQQIKAKYLEWIADPHIDAVIVISGAKTESAGEALQPLVTKPLPGFADLFRSITFDEIGTSAMLVDAAAGQCKSTFVFVLPASVGAVRTALDKLLLSQLDYRTKPLNLVMRMPRHHRGSSLDNDTPIAKTPWIVPRGQGAPVAVAPKKTRAGTEPGTPAALASATSTSVSQRIAVAAIARPEPVSVSQRMSAILEAASPAIAPPVNAFVEKETIDVGVPPPPPTRPKATTAKDNVPLKPPAQIIPLSQLLTNKPPPPSDEPVEELPVTELQDVAPAQIIDGAPAQIADGAPAQIADGAPAQIADGAPAQIADGAPTQIAAAAAPAEITDTPPGAPASAPASKPARAGRIDDVDFDAPQAPPTPPEGVPIPAILSTKIPTGPIRIEDESTREAILAAQKRAVTERVTPLDDLPPRSVAIPARRRRDPKLVAIWSVIVLAAASLVVMFVIARERDRRAQALSDQQRETDNLLADLAPPTPPPLLPEPRASAIPDAGTDDEPEEPEEIDMGVDPDAIAAPNPRVAANPVRPAAMPQPRAPRSAVERPTTRPSVERPAIDKPAIEKPAIERPAPEAPPVEAGCDEVSCVLDRYRLSCCAKYKPAEPATPPVRSGLPEKLDKPMVTAGIAKVKPAVIACGEKTGAKGQVKISVTVGADGSVTDASVAAAPDPALGACVAAAVRRATFAKTATGGSFTYPFVF